MYQEVQDQIEIFEIWFGLLLYLSIFLALDASLQIKAIWTFP